MGTIGKRRNKEEERKNGKNERKDLTLTGLLMEGPWIRKLETVFSPFVVSSVLQLCPAQSASHIPKPCDRLRKIRAHARPDRATKWILLRGVARDDDHRLSPCMISDVGLRRPVVEGAGPQRPAGPVGADDDARGRSLRADEREFPWRGSIRKETFACA